MVDRVLVVIVLSCCIDEEDAQPLFADDVAEYAFCERCIWPFDGSIELVEAGSLLVPIATMKIVLRHKDARRLHVGETC